MVYAIILDIDDDSKDLEPMYNKIKSIGAWMHYLEWAWLVEPSGKHDANSIFNLLREYIDEEDDYLFVTGIQPDFQGWLPEEAWEWIHERIF